MGPSAIGGERNYMQKAIARSENPNIHAPDEPALVLMVEDNSADVYLVEQAFRKHNIWVRLVVMDDGEKAIRWIEEANRNPTAETPRAILLDLNLPKRTGTEVLERLRACERFRDLPVVIFTSSNSNQDRSLATKFRATRFLRKSADFDEFLEVGQVIKDVLSGGISPSVS